MDLIARVQYLKYSNYYAGGDRATHRSRPTSPARRRRRRSSAPTRPLDRPWLSDGTRASLLITQLRADTSAPATNAAAQRRQRFYTLQALMLGGPDGQVM